MSRQLRVFGRLLRLLPADFQADYGRDMEHTFKAQHRPAREAGLPGSARLWLDTVTDLVRTAPRQHPIRSGGLRGVCSSR